MYFINFDMDEFCSYMQILCTRWSVHIVSEKCYLRKMVGIYLPNFQTNDRGKLIYLGFVCKKAFYLSSLFFMASEKMRSFYFPLRLADETAKNLIFGQIGKSQKSTDRLSRSIWDE